MMWLIAGLALYLAGAGQDSVVYRLSPSSRFEVRTGKAGVLGFAGHEHLIRARRFSGAVVYHATAPHLSRVEIRIETAGLEVLTPPDSAEIRKVTEAMRTEVLHVERFPEIALVSKTITPSRDGFHLVCDLTIAGQTREVPIDARVSITADTVRATAAFSINQTSFGIIPYRGGPGGTVRVADRVTFDIEAIAVRGGESLR
jgi:polyisoprenoid-binding protein YceI